MFVMQGSLSRPHHFSSVFAAKPGCWHAAQQLSEPQEQMSHFAPPLNAAALMSASSPRHPLVLTSVRLCNPLHRSLRGSSWQHGRLYQTSACRCAPLWTNQLGLFALKKFISTDSERPSQTLTSDPLSPTWAQLSALCSYTGISSSNTSEITSQLLISAQSGFNADHRESTARSCVFIDVRLKYRVLLCVFQNQRRRQTSFNVIYSCL